MDVFASKSYRLWFGVVARSLLKNVPLTPWDTAKFLGDSWLTEHPDPHTKFHVTVCDHSPWTQENSETEGTAGGLDRNKMVVSWVVCGLSWAVKFPTESTYTTKNTKKIDVIEI